MSTTIVAPTCPLPLCYLTVQDVETLRPEVAAYVDQFATCFARTDQHTWAHRYLKGLLSVLPRKRMACCWLMNRACPNKGCILPLSRANTVAPPAK